MGFLDFERRISEGADGAYSVAVVHSPTGEATATMRLPFDAPELQRRLQVLRNVRGTGGQTRKSGDPGRALVLPQETDATARDTVKDFGRGLFEALLPSEVRSCYRSSRNTAREQGKGLRLRLRVDAPELAALPVRLTLNGAIRLRTLSRDQISAHLTRAGSRFETLQALLQRDSSLQVLAQTPFESVSGK